MDEGIIFIPLFPLHIQDHLFDCVLQNVITHQYIYMNAMCIAFICNEFSKVFVLLMVYNIYFMPSCMREVDA